MGYLYVLGAFFCIGSYLVPMRFATVKGSAFFPFMVFGLILAELFRWTSLQALWAHPLWFWCSVSAGLLWAVGQIFGNLALEEISLAKARVFANSNSFLNIAVGLIIFREASGLQAYLLLLGGGLLIFLGTWIVSSAKAMPMKEKSLKKGIIFGLLNSFFWGINLAPVKALQVWHPDPSLSNLDILTGLVLGGILPVFFFGFFMKRGTWTPRNAGLGIGCAVLWLLGMAFTFAAIQSLGLSRAIPMINASALVYVGWSFFLFKELPLSQGPKVLSGTLLVILGIVFLTLT